MGNQFDFKTEIIKLENLMMAQIIINYQKWGNMKHAYIKIACTLTSGLLMTGLQASVSNAYVSLGCKWNSNNITWVNAATSAYKTTMTNAVSSWNATATPITLGAVSIDSSYNIRLIDVNYGNTSYDGITYSSCSSGKYSGVTQSAINSYFGASYDANTRKQLMVHEIGHALGLGHSGSSSCSGQPIMYSSSSRYTVCGHINPQADDVNGINGIY